MFSFATPAVYQTSKCFVTHGKLGHLDSKQVPSKSKPWTTLANQDFIHRTDLVLPQEAFELIQNTLLANKPAPQFQRVVMSLSDIVASDFLAEYIKKGDVLMLSQGRRGVDNVYSVRHGILTLYLDKEAYERAGLVGRPHGVKGNRGLKPRWIVEYDLTSKSMFPGKKGFDRLVWACKNALNAPATWLFCNISTTTPSPDPLAKHNPTTLTVDSTISQELDALTPNLKVTIDPALPGARDEFEYLATEIYEWLSLVRLQSPRIQPTDSIDSYLCRYHVPGAVDGLDQPQPQQLCKITWQGFMSPSWSRQTLIDLITTLPSKTWFSFSTTTFSKGLTGDNAECTFLRPPNSVGEYLLWEVKSHE